MSRVPEGNKSQKKKSKMDDKIEVACETQEFIEEESSASSTQESHNAQVGEPKASEKKWISGKSTTARNEDVIRYIPLIHKVISRLLYRVPYMMEEEDMVAVGVLGLIDALERYQPGALAFHHYAEIRIRGSILDELRRADVFSRGMRRKAKRYREAVIQLKNRLNRMPRIQEIADLLQVDITEVEELRDQVQPVVFTDIEKLDLGEEAQIGAGNGIFSSKKQKNDPFFQTQKKEIKEKVKQALERLPERERLILSFYYFEEMTLREIGELLNLSESRICQIHRKACKNLKNYLELKGEDLSAVL